MNTQEEINKLLKNGDLNHLDTLLYSNPSQLHYLLNPALLNSPSINLQVELDSSLAWIHLLRAYVLFPQDLQAAQLFYRTAYLTFKKRNCEEGQLQAWAGIVACTFFRYENWRDLIDFHDEIYPLLSTKKLRTFPETLSTPIVSAVILTHFVMCPESEVSRPWSEFARNFLLRATNSNSTNQSLLAFSLVLQSTWQGDYRSARDSLQHAYKLMNSKNIGYFDQGLILIAGVFFEWMDGFPTQALKHLESLEKLAQHTQHYGYYHTGIAHGVFAALSLNNHKQARQISEKINDGLLHPNRHDLGYYYLARAFVEKDSVPHQYLKEYLEGAIHSAKQLGAQAPYILSHIVSADLWLSCHKLDSAKKHLEIAKDLITPSHGHLCWCVFYFSKTRYLMLKGAQKKELSDTLKQAFHYAYQGGITNYWASRPEDMAQFCAIALQEGIQISFVKQIIQKRHLYELIQPLHIEQWVWQVKIYVLGDFELYVNDQLISFPHKSQKRVLELLKILIALGGKNVPIYKICDVLWTDSEGDAAHKACETTLYRLRKLLGGKDTMLLDNGKLSLNPQRVWVDLWLAESIVQDDFADDFFKPCEAVRQQYLDKLKNEPFLKGEAHYGWVVQKREGG